MKQMKNDLIVTGIQRGGTTLTTALLDSLTNCVCLSEPNWQLDWVNQSNDSNEIVDFLIKDFNKVRTEISNNKPIIDRRKNDGSAITNYYERNEEGDPKRIEKIKRTIFKVENNEFLLGMKHPALYTSILPELIEKKHFSIIAIIRHPIPTILSWNSLNLYISRAHVPHGAPFWAELRSIIKSKDKLIDKHVKVYDLVCQRYLALREELHLLKYEDIIQDPSILEKITNRRYEKRLEINNQNKNSAYDYSLVEELKESLQRYAPNALKLYSLDKF
ncbi:hypothetical protein BKP45_18975 [Anaerobacillus alkalidiazotrophicus]|uniref:Sulfotransferase domain-containing protein n=1 Tax=Anaerobacillus alkalidiazotrophicus TaxID=472963 RepID=A0A1S2M1E1_9BACI|nr:sulfotransferase domain-containing protein [Anaerobacillus alkalidiazotrophicus]OIJ18529.1 hypothetical protein BKP45_18975 [Anaerobacillus alkalidiazotrophicus]